MSNSFESNLIKIPAKDVVDELYGKPPTKGERDIAEFRKKKIKTPEKMTSQELQELFDHIKTSETESLKNFFGMGIEVPSLPEEITPERYAEWKEMGFELHYLPKMDMREDKEYPGWQKKPNDLFKYVKDSKVDKEATNLKASWILIDERAKPQYDYGKQMYKDDPLKEALRQLRAKGIIEDCEIKDSRFNISNDELQKEEVKQALAEVLKVRPKDISLPRAIEWNYLGNAFYQEWGQTDTWEWFEDEYKGGDRLLGGLSVVGGLASVGSNSAGYRDGSSGFRPLVRFPEK